MEASFESNGETTPEFRAAILGEMLRLISVQLVVVPYEEVLAHIMKAYNCTEEQVGGEVAASWFLLESARLIKSNDFTVIRAGTNAIPSKLVTSYIWEDIAQYSDDGEGA